MSSVCVHGLGYIGLPTAAMLAAHGHDVYGYDADPVVTRELRDGDVGLDEPGLEAFVVRAMESGRLEIVDDVAAAAYHVICVPTPFDEETRQPDLDYVAAAARAVGSVLRAGDTAVLESTVPPGTTARHVRPIVEGESGLVAGRDFGLAHCPETVLPGDVIAELRENDRIVGGIDERSATAAVELYETFAEGEIRTTAGPTTAEFVKLIQNTARDVEVALANEIARIAHDYGIDSREAIEMANAHPRVDILQPGPGVGGHCLPIDPWFLGVGSDALDLVPTARAVNNGMIGFVVELLEELLADLDGKRVAVFGVAYKGNVDDTRMSPGLELVRELQHGQKPSTPATDGGTPETPGVAIHDPHVADPTLRLQDVDDAVTGADAVVITADHDEFTELDPDRLRGLMAEPNVVDTKGILDLDRWRTAGFDVRRV
ncbi:nucleotide sugar dehydrogenase [Halobellus limi]|uniref:UDP-N-acetyl-D-mannosamine dehydrogenase n=1 Tax=Halobellus limi TaxID=699433 RepID=A0A1H6BE12_9EURY|nr:nucleotide sugar dehydrogenase [Halobellus limi]QCC49278.1 nucleotide sugar dehydrogenase [Halobellus limi]SEG58466.1 UDP-N-acetyl-D-mannosaminuronic acid dehydrogenase [Halobellus limi]